MFETISDPIYAADEFFRSQLGSSPDDGSSEEPLRSLPKVLVVDDERRIADTLKEILEMADFMLSRLMTAGVRLTRRRGFSQTICSQMY